MNHTISYEINHKIMAAVDHLNQVLPLKARQDGLSAPLAKLHRDILAAYVKVGRTLNREEMAPYVADVDEAVQILKRNDLVLFNDHGEPIGAYPFTMEPRQHKLTVNGHLVHSMCALDALAVSPMFDVALEIQSSCRVTGESITLKQKGFDILNANEVQDLFFGINWNAASCHTSCADSLCTEMIFLKGDAVAHDWRDEEPENKQIFALDEAIEFAARFFMPLVMQNEPVLITENGTPIMTVYAAPQNEAESWQMSQSQDLDGLLEHSRQSLRQEGGLSRQELGAL